MEKEPTAKDLMRKKFPTLKKTDSLDKAIKIFITKPDIVFPVVDENGKFVGEIIQHELLKMVLPPRYVEEGTILGPRGIMDIMERYATVVGDLMRTHEVKIRADMRVGDIVKLMLDSDVKTLEVVDNKGRPLGFLSDLDILRHIDKTLLARKKVKNR
ncbi:MAG: CBS domain-containing protein [Candidatus Altiarchaeota archaeon]|nr:CBS domain-containing protein [Candidatus Altiarchaeota archaeon]